MRTFYFSPNFENEIKANNYGLDLISFFSNLPELNSELSHYHIHSITSTQLKENEQMVTVTIQYSIIKLGGKRIDNFEWTNFRSKTYTCQSIQSRLVDVVYTKEFFESVGVDYRFIVKMIEKAGFEYYSSHKEEDLENDISLCKKGEYSGEVVDLLYNYKNGEIFKLTISSQFKTHSPKFHLNFGKKTTSN